MRAARQNLRKVWSDAARAAAAAARSANAKGGAGKAGSALSGGAGGGERTSAGGAFTPGGGETVDQAKAKANAYIAAHPDQFKPKGAKGAGKGKGASKGAGKKAADPAAAKAKAAKEAQAAQEHAQRQKEHAEDRAQRQADRAQRQKEHAQAQAEHEQTRAEHEADRQARLKAQADKAKQQASKAKAKAGASGGKKSGGGSKKGNQFTEAAHQLHIDAVNAKANARNAKLTGAGPAPASLTGNELSVPKARKMAKVAANIASVLEQTGLAKRDIPTKTRSKMDDSSFVFGDERAFPIQKPEDVMAAVRSWGRYKGAHSFADFKRSLTRLAHKKGFALPDAWKEQTQKRGGFIKEADVRGFAARTQKLAKGATPLTSWHGWAEITKVDEDQRIVYGVASSELPDNEPGIWKGTTYQGDVISSDAMRAAAPAYLQFPAIREMHQPVAAGTAVHFEVQGAETLIGAHIVDDQAWAKVVNKVYRGFSIGGRCRDAEIIKIDGQPFRKVTKLDLTEISLVDRPRNPDAKITLFKGEFMDAVEQDATEVAEDTIAKAADPSKAIALLQQLRNDAENEGDTDAADAYTDAIRQVLVASGVAQSGADEEDDGTDDTGADDSGLAMDDGTGDVAMGATTGDLAKAGAVLSSANHALARTAHDALQKMTGGAVCQPQQRQQAGDIAMADGLTGQSLTKALAPALDGIAKVLEANGIQLAALAERLDKVERQTAPGAPAARVVAIEKSLPGSDGPAVVSTEAAELDALRKVRDSATDDTVRKAVANEITMRELRNVYKPIQ